ncbi:hypothetical protein Tco_0400273 [Tanacetum coccineum]
MSLSSALIATVAFLIIVVVVAIVVVVVIIVVGISRSAPTILGQMANPLAVVAPRPGLCSASYFVVVVDSDCFGSVFKLPLGFQCLSAHATDVSWALCGIPPTITFQFVWNPRNILNTESASS